MQRINHRKTQPEPIFSSRTEEGNSRATAIEAVHLPEMRLIASAIFDAGMARAMLRDIGSDRSLSLRKQN
ncbi:hypothetical protein RBSWK_03219 [Rhodopirellula baltica SWK14]|uniref:Uncharacterized protein n=1 Tax=Rhodopirellula baltica SWK14 TaxID=993516 RepID=L7CF22_RHOBT|nr:hypothetical protein RBSWK_03219 [Rhodopirellula baltica SWK14]